MKRILITMAIVAFIGTASAVTISALDHNDNTVVTTASDDDKKKKKSKSTSKKEAGQKTCSKSCCHTSKSKGK